MKMTALALAMLSGQLLAGPWYFMPDQRFMPENTLHITDKFITPSDVSEDDFNRVLDQVEEFYKPLIKDVHQADFVIERNWEDPTVNAYAIKSDKWAIHMFGGLARRVTVDAFQMVSCHETGHLIGGWPFVQAENEVSDEGQSDYFATLSCARELWKDEHDKNAQAARTVPRYPKKLCDGAWKGLEDRQLCYRMAQAAKSLAALLSAGTARYETPDQRIVKSIDHTHPAGQCRLDTYLAGAMCPIPFDAKILPKNQAEAEASSCFAKKHQKGFRPKCWFKE